MAWVDTRVPTSYGDVFALVFRVVGMAAIWYVVVAMLMNLVPSRHGDQMCWGDGFPGTDSYRERCVEVKTLGEVMRAPDHTKGVP